VVLALHCLFLLGIRRLRNQSCQQFVLARPTISNIGQAPHHEVRVFVDFPNTAMPQLKHALRQVAPILHARQISPGANAPGN